jgi:DNA replication protein DnaC
VLDEWSMVALSSKKRTDLQEIIDDRSSDKIDVLISQLLISRCHAYYGNAKNLEAMLSRNMKRNYYFVLSGEVLGQNPTSKKGGRKKSIINI